MERSDLERLAQISEQANAATRLALAVHHIQEAEISLAMLANGDDFWEPASWMHAGDSGKFLRDLRNRTRELRLMLEHVRLEP